MCRKVAWMPGAQLSYAWYMLTCGNCGEVEIENVCVEAGSLVGAVKWGDNGRVELVDGSVDNNNDADSTERGPLNILCEECYAVVNVEPENELTFDYADMLLDVVIYGKLKKEFP